MVSKTNDPEVPVTHSRVEALTCYELVRVMSPLVAPIKL